MQIINPKISIIIPVYNVEQYLSRCIDSILAQTFTDFELLLIDDGSKDNSGKICDEYEKKDNRIRVFHKENGGVSSARNVGLDNAVGEWICFSDGDDSVKSDYLATFFYLMTQGDMLSQGFHALNWNHKGDKDIFATKGIYYGKNLCPFILKLLKTAQLGYIWCKSFKKEIIDKYKIRFDENVYLMEDLEFVLEYCTHINSINNSDKCLYLYKYTASGKIFHDQNHFEVYKKLYLLSREIDVDNLYTKWIKSFFIDDILYRLLNEKVEKNILKEHITFFISEFKSEKSLCKFKKNRLYNYLHFINNRIYIYILIKMIRVL